MSDTEQLNDPLSLKISKVRTQLLETLQKQLETCIAEQIIPQAEGVPFTNISSDPAQIASIKKVINALYHSEQGLKNWEAIDTSTIKGKIKLAPQTVSALNQIYKSLSQLNDATPEIQSIIADNYYLLEPVFSGAYEVIQKSGWVNEFSKMEAPDKASKLINQGISLLGPNITKWNSSNPVFEPFSKLSQLMNLTSDESTKSLPRRERVERMGDLIHDLEVNPLFKSIAVSGVEESKAVSDLLDWFRNTQEDNFEFTQESINKYISWANHYLPILIVAVDRFERQSYLKSGLLTGELIKSADKLATEINEQIASSFLDTTERVALVSSLTSIREQSIEVSQIEQVQEIVNARNNKRSLGEFILILERYKGQSLSDILEPDRIQLRQIYPDIQYALAHSDFDLENKIVQVLNTVGLAEKPEEPVKSWWQYATGVASNAASYVASFVVSGEIDKILAKQNSVYDFFNTKIDTAQLKITVAEQARDRLNGVSAPLEERVQARISLLETQLPTPPVKTPIIPGDLIPVKASSLKNLRGNLAYIQELRLSEKVLATGINIDTLVQRHLPQIYETYFSSPPYGINPDEPELVRQLKAVENNIYNLSESLRQFENTTSDFGLVTKARMLSSIINIGLELKQSVTLLSPTARQVLAPVMNQLMAYGTSMSAINSKSSDLSELGLLNQLDNTLPQQSDKSALIQNSPFLTATEKAVFEQGAALTEGASLDSVKEEVVQTEQAGVPIALQKEQVKEEADSSFEELAANVASARTLLLNKFKSTLSNPLARLINPEANGVPFIHFEEQPPQVVAIKKVINCLYYAESALRTIDKMNSNSDSMFNKVILAHQKIAALSQVYKAMSQLNDAAPEIQSIIADNYYLLEPVFSETYDVIQKSGWVSEFSKMETTEKASFIINKGTELLGPDKSKWNSSNPLMEPLSKLSRLFNVTSDASGRKKLPDDVRRERIELIISITQDLETNPFFQKITVRGLEESKAVSDILDWFKNIQEDDFEFTQESIKKYISWTNHYLPKLIVAVDQFEQQNYLKPGLLTGELSASADKLANVINDQIASSFLNIKERVASVSSLASIREQSIDANQMKQVQDINEAQRCMRSVDKFYLILQNYSGKSYSDILEPDRVRLRQIYPDIQFALAHSDLDLENNLTKVLNTEGLAEKPKEPVSEIPTHYAFVVDSPADSIVVSDEIDKILVKRNSVNEFFNTKIAAEQLKVTVSELAREQLDTDQEVKESSSHEERVQARISLLEAKLPKPPVQTLIKPGDLIPVKATSLKNLRGNLLYLQELRLSEKVNATSVNIDTLVQRHLPQLHKTYFSSPPYEINPDEPELVRQLKAVENNLYNLKGSLNIFENTSSDFGRVTKVQMFSSMFNIVIELKQSVTLLSPAARQVLSPVMNQLMAYGTSMSAIDGKSSDLSELSLLNQLDITLPQQSDKPVLVEDSTLPSATKQDAALTGGTSLAPVKEEIVQSEQVSIPIVFKKEQVGEEADLYYEELAANITTARTLLLNKLQSTLSSPLARMINPEPDGVPFINFEDEPSQVTAIKKVINCMYYAESALRIRHKMNFNTNSMFDNVILAHQGVAALSQASKSISLLGSASPEIGKIIQNNHDLIDPMFRAVDQLVKSTGWTNRLNAIDITKTVGSYLGQGLNLVQSDEKISKGRGLVSLLSDLPLVMNKIAKRLDPTVRTDEDKIKMTQGQIDSISTVAEYFIDGSGSVLNLIKGPHALISLLDLSTKINREGDKLQNTTVIAYQEWIDKEYPKLLTMIDEVEVRNYLKPGLLSSALMVEVDAINKKLNETVDLKLLDLAIAKIEAGVDSKQEEVKEPGSIHMLKMIKVSADLLQTRDANLRQIQYEIWSDTFNNEVQQNASRDFFAIIARYKEKSFTEISPEDRSNLRIAFAKIQDPMSFANLDLANEFLSALNQLELSNDNVQEMPFTIAQLMSQEHSVQKYLEEQKKTLMFKFEIIDEARTQLDPSADHKTRRDLDELAMLKARDAYLEDRKTQPKPGPGELKTVTISSTKTVRGSISKLQELKLSSHVEVLRAQFSSITKDKMSGHIQEYLKKPEGASLHVIHESDPVIPRHIKQLENGLYYLESSLKRFEQLDKNAAFLPQLRLILEIEEEVRIIKQGINNLSPELKVHYGPLIQKALDFYSMVQQIDYDKEDTKELQDVLKRAKEDLLKLKHPPQGANTAANNAAEQEPKLTPALRGLKLGVKYLHVVSPQMERARAHLLTKYGYAFDPQPLGFRSFTREQLSDKQFMLDEVHRINNLLDTAGYFDLKKSHAIIDISKQVIRVGSQAGELAGMVNKLIKDEYVHIKEASYRDYVTALSREEDYLCLKPGTLINQGTTLLNQLFLSAALELDMPFNEKMKLLDDAHYLNIVVEETQKDLKELEEQLKTKPQNQDLSLNIAIKKDKLELLNQQIELHKTKDLSAIKSSLLDMQFEVDLRDALYKSFLNPPIIDQYEHAIRKLYTDNKRFLLTAQDSGQELSHLLDEFEKKQIGDYLIVSKAIKKLATFCIELPENNRYVKDYLLEIVVSLSNEEIPIKDRAEHVKSLPKDTTFVNTLSLAVGGLSFLTRFKQFVERITQCIIEGITTGANIVARYYEIKMDQKMDNIEKSLQFKAEVNAIKPTEVVEQAELSTGEQIEKDQTELTQSELSTEDLDNEEEDSEDPDYRSSNTY
jgi:transcription antitermination factor NusG